MFAGTSGRILLCVFPTVNWGSLFCIKATVMAWEHIFIALSPKQSLSHRKFTLEQLFTRCGAALLELLMKNVWGSLTVFSATGCWALAVRYRISFLVNDPARLSWQRVSIISTSGRSILYLYLYVHMLHDI